MVQNIIAKKRVFEVVETFSNFPDKFDFELSIVGHGSDILINKLKNFILENNLTKKVKLYGRLKESKILSLYTSVQIVSLIFQLKIQALFQPCRL